MRYVCHFCGKSVSSSLPDDTVIRAIMICPECIALSVGEFDRLAEGITEELKRLKEKK